MPPTELILTAPTHPVQCPLGPLFVIVDSRDTLTFRAWEPHELTVNRIAYHVRYRMARADVASPFAMPRDKRGNLVYQQLDVRRANGRDLAVSDSARAKIQAELESLAVALAEGHPEWFLEGGWFAANNELARAEQKAAKLTAELAEANADVARCRAALDAIDEI